jgi:hypothetical protein
MTSRSRYVSLPQGLAGLDIPADTGPIPPDGHNVWNAIITGSRSPRNEVVTLPLSNPYVNVSASPGGGACAAGHGCATSYRMGRWKIIIGDGGPAGLCNLPPPSEAPVQFGGSGGKCGFGGVPDNCVSGGGAAPDWGWNLNQTFPAYNTACEPYCIFDVEADVGERTNLADTPDGKGAAQKLIARLRVLSRTGVPQAGHVYPGPESHGYKTQLMPIICANANATGFFLPADWPMQLPADP